MHHFFALKGRKPFNSSLVIGDSGEMVDECVAAAAAYLCSAWDTFQEELFSQSSDVLRTLQQVPVWGVVGEHYRWCKAELVREADEAHTWVEGIIWNTGVVCRGISWFLLIPITSQRERTNKETQRRPLVPNGDQLTERITSSEHQNFLWSLAVVTDGDPNSLIFILCMF